MRIEDHDEDSVIVCCVDDERVTGTTVLFKEIRRFDADGDLVNRREERYIRVPRSQITPEIESAAQAQWDRERIQSGDPPYSIGNDWLQKVKAPVAL